MTIWTIWDVSHPPEPCSETVSRLRNLYPRSTQNTDAVSSINFPNPDVSCSIYIIIYINPVKSVNVNIIENTGTIRWQ